MTDQSIRSNDQTFMLNTKTPTFSTRSRPSLTPLKDAESFLLSGTISYPFRISIIFNATANPSQTLYQPHTAPNKGSSASVPSSPSVPTVIPINPSHLILQI